MNKEEWKCCMCPKSKAHKHEELWSFGPYGDNPYKKNDSKLGNEYCKKHFIEKELELDAKLSQ